MFKEKYIFIKASPKVKKWYDNLNYNYVGQGNLFKIKINDLYPTSNYKIEMICDICNRTYTTKRFTQFKSFNKYHKDLCRSCNHKGNLNGSYNKDRSQITAYARSFQKKNGMKGRHHSKEAKEKMSKRKAYLISNGLYGKGPCNIAIKGYYKSIKNNEIFLYDSILEKARMIQLDQDDSVISWTKNHNIKIKYIYNNYFHYYIPDFKVVTKDTIYIEEVKGRILKKDPIKFKIAQEFCQLHNFTYKILYEKDIGPLYKKLLKERRKKE